MKQIFTILVALLATTNLWAGFQYGELYYYITSSSDPYTVEVGGAESSITTVIIPETVTYEGTTYSVTSIGNWAFHGCKSLTFITIPNSVTSIGIQAFYGCESLTSVTIPNSVTSIGERAFWDCSSLTSVTIGNSVTSIGDYAFSDCLSLTSVTIGNSVTSIGWGAFWSCESLTSITLPYSVTSIGDWAFHGCYSLPVENNLRYADTYLVEAVDETLSTYSIKEGTKWIGNRAFQYCSSLTSITIPYSVTSIGENAFVECNALTSITIPNSVTSIGNYAFSFCWSLTSITIPNSVTSIGNYAFAHCYSLKTVICEAIEVPELGYGVFYDMPVSEATLYVPAQSLDDYKAAEQWKEFGTILPIEETSTGVENTYNPSSTAVTNKLIRDGQLIIVRGGKSYSVTGQEL